MSIPLLLAKRGFHPRQLFAALQGAWLEPVVGSIWQENTGVTPTTTGGQTIGLMLDQSQGAVLGPELVTNGDFSVNSDWTYGTGWAYGTGNAQCTANGGYGTLRQTISALTVGRAYQLTWTQTTTVGTVRVGLDGASVGLFGSFGGNTTYTVRIFPSTTNRLLVFAAIGNDSSGNFTGTIDNISVREILGNHASQSVSGNRPTYQLNSNSLPLARHDTTDSLSVSLPEINVRRNLLTYSEQFDNAAWVKANAAVTANAALAPDGTATADKVIVSTGGSLGNTYQTPTLSANTFYTYSVYAKKSELNWVALEFRGELFDSRAAWFNLNSGVIGTVQSGLTATITPASNGYYRCSVTGDTKLTAGSTRTRVYPTNSDNTYTTGDGTSGVLVWGAQLELGSTATDYQKITDWTNEAYSSNGSVYFATPVGMSALHNQSMGSTYNLPALSSDIYSWMVFPQRLSTVLESRLERYMLRKAGIAGPDYLLDSSDNQLTADDGEQLLLAQ